MGCVRRDSSNTSDKLKLRIFDAGRLVSTIEACARIIEELQEVAYMRKEHEISMVREQQDFIQLRRAKGYYSMQY